MMRRKTRSGFTLLELTLVIAILGIVASVGAGIISKVYEQYIVQRALSRATVKTELAALQIANRLRYAITGTVYRRPDKDSAAEEITTPAGGGAYKVLQWVGYDGDGFEAISSTTNLGRHPGWSGFCDLNVSAGTTLSTPGSRLSFAKKIIENLGGELDESWVYFANHIDAPAQIASRNGDENLTLTATPAIKSEQYKLAWSSYALVIEDGDLYLYHHFQPTPADLPTPVPDATAANRSLLLRDIATLRFRGDGGTIRFKICKSEKISSTGSTVNACKEKAVF